MKSRIKLTGLFIIAAAIIITFGFSSCPTEYVDSYEPDALLLSLKMGDLIISGENIPEAIQNIDWEDDDFELYAADYKTISFRRDTDIVDAWIVPTVSRGAKIRWGIANRSARPGRFEDTRVPATFDDKDFLYFMVMSEDNAIINYYRFASYVSSPVKELAGIEIAGREADMDAVMPASAWDGETIAYGLIYITVNESQNAVIEAQPWDETSTVRYAKTSDVDEVPVFQNGNTFAFADRDWLTVEVAAENTLDINYYRFMVYVGRIATVAGLKLGDFDVFSLGTPYRTWTAAGLPGGFSTALQPSEGFAVSVTLDDPAASWSYAKISSTGSAQPGSGDWKSPGAGSLKFDNDEALIVRVVSETGVSTNFYKLRISLLAAEFDQHPMSAVYNANDPAEPLTFELDRTGNFSYQWYEANSWYGGYGFDEEGRVLGDTNFNVGGTNTEWHRERFDEKRNATFHNGGNEYYRLPTPGRPIPGAIGTTYTPPTDKPVFIGGYSNESHYYWVVVTNEDDPDLKAVSNRAVIVTEWGQLFESEMDEDGNPTGVMVPSLNSASEEITVTKKHYIVDLNNLTDPETGEKVPAKNPVVFNVFREKYYIPLSFPSDFDIMDYSVCIAQAKFFLRDGTPWIQNWTQGNLAFEDSSKENIVLYYNLTNNNGTLGLAGDGKEPQGASLEETPAYVVFMPSGEKPIKRMPPLLADGKPDPDDGDAQGWFCGFIELVEFRFEGPSRK